MININLFTKLFFLFVFISSLTSEAQINPVYRIMKQRGWTSPIENWKGKPTPEEVEAENLVSLGYSNTTVTNLKKIGVDLLGLHKGTGRWNVKVWTALSDCIVIGTVSRIEHPLTEKPWFNTVAHINVEEFLRNDYNLTFNQIHVMIASGPNVIQVGEDTLRFGEHVLLFLSANGLIQMASYSHMQDLYNHLINDPKIKFEKLAKYDIESGKLFIRGNKRSLTEVKDEIMTVLNVVSHSIIFNNRIIYSPNKKFYAHIITYQFKENGNFESKIEIRSSRNELMVSQSYVSEDHEHGIEINKAQWTKDSKYFIFNGSFQSGHQPGHVPTYFYNSIDKKINAIVSYAGIWITNDFILGAQDRITVMVTDRNHEGNLRDSVIKTVDLNKLLIRK